MNYSHMIALCGERT